MKERRFVLLDRDGTIIVERNHLCCASEVELLPHAASGMRKMRELGLGLVVITNQSVVGRGFIDTEGLDRIHERLRELLGLEGVSLDGIYVCPHLPEDKCDCRKPGTALLGLAAKEQAFEPRQAFVIGDKECDISFGQKAGATTILVLTGYGKETCAERRIEPDFVVDGLDGAAYIISVQLGENEKGGK